MINLWKILWKIRLGILVKAREFGRRKARQVHVEAYHLDWVWERIKQNIHRPVTWYIVTPANYGYIRNFIGANLSKEELDQILSERARWMIKNGCRVELHMYFWRFEKMPTDLKRSRLKEAMEWGEKNGIKFKELVPGWWRGEEDLLKLCQELGIKLVNREISTHDYNL